MRTKYSTRQGYRDGNSRNHFVALFFFRLEFTREYTSTTINNYSINVTNTS